MEEIKVELTLDMGEVETIIRQMAKAYGWDQVEEIVRCLREENEGQ